jgi:RNA polymerase sigma factor (sigma-70 family)
MQPNFCAPSTRSADAIVKMPDQTLMNVLVTASDPEMFAQAFEEFFARYNRQVARWCCKMVRDQDRALDLTQEIFVKAFRNLHTFRGDSQVSTWLYVITRNHCLNRLKRSRREPGDQRTDWEFNHVPAKSDDAHLALERTQSCHQTLQFLGSLLTPTETRVMILHYVHEMTLPAITSHLLLSNPSGAKAYIVSARRKLRPLTTDPAEFRRRLNLWSGTSSTRKKAA